MNLGRNSDGGRVGQRAGRGGWILFKGNVCMYEILKQNKKTF